MLILVITIGFEHIITCSRDLIELDITKDDFIGGYGLYIFDLSPDKCFGEHFNVLKSGNLKLKLSFRETLATVVNLYVYMEFDNMLEITKNRNVIFDYTV